MAWCMGEECAHQDVAQLGDEGDGLDGERARHLGLGGLRFLGRLCRLLLLRQLFWQAQLPPPLPPILLCASRQAHQIYKHVGVGQAVAENSKRSALLFFRCVRETCPQA